MTLPLSRRQFLGTSAGSAVALASGPLLAQADALPSRKVTVGIMGLNRGMEVAAALEKQPGVVIKYVCDVDSKRADEAKAKLERSGQQRPQAITDFRRILDDKEVDALFCAAPNHWHAPADDPGVRRRQARLRREAVQPQPARRRADGRRPPASTSGAVQMGNQRRSCPASSRRSTKLHEGRHRPRLLARERGTTTTAPSHRPRQGRPTRRRRSTTTSGRARPRARPYLAQLPPLQLALVLALGQRRARQQRRPHRSTSAAGAWASITPSASPRPAAATASDDDQETPDTHVVSFDFPGGKRSPGKG